MSRNVIEAVVNVHNDHINQAKHGNLSLYEMYKHKDIVVTIIDESQHVKTIFSHSKLIEEMLNAFNSVDKRGGETLKIVEMGKVFVDISIKGVN